MGAHAILLVLSRGGSFNFTERELSEEMSSQTDESSDTESDSDSNSNNKVTVYSRQKSNNKNGKTDDKHRRGSWWTSILGSFFDKYPVLKSIDGRAASVHNFMRGLSLYKAYPFSPFTSIDSQRKAEDKLEGTMKYHFNPFTLNGLFCPCKLDKSISLFKGCPVYFLYLFFFLQNIAVCKQCGP